MIVEPGPGDLPERREIRGDALVFKFGPERKTDGVPGQLQHQRPVHAPAARRGRAPVHLRHLLLRQASIPLTGEAETITFDENVLFERKNQRGKGDKAEFSREDGADGGVRGQPPSTTPSTRCPWFPRPSTSIREDGSFRAWGGVRHTQKGGMPGAPFGTAGSDLLATSRQVIYEAPLKKTQYLDRVVLRAGEDEMRALTIETVESPARAPRITADTDVEILVAGGAWAAGSMPGPSKMTYAPADRRFTFTGRGLGEAEGLRNQGPGDPGRPRPRGRLRASEPWRRRAGLVTIKAMDRTAEGTHLLYTPEGRPGGHDRDTGQTRGPGTKGPGEIRDLLHLGRSGRSGGRRRAHRNRASEKDHQP